MREACDQWRDARSGYTSLPPATGPTIGLGGRIRNQNRITKEHTTTTYLGSTGFQHTFLFLEGSNDSHFWEEAASNNPTKVKPD
jgi:hypothetical protein